MLLSYFKRPRTDSVQPGEALPPEAGPRWAGRYVSEVFHGHYPFLGNYARFTVEDGDTVEFWFGRRWEPSP